MKVRLLVTSVLYAVGSVAFPAPAQALPAWECGSGNFCVFEHDYGAGRAWGWSGSDSDYRDNWNNGMAADNNASSAYNNGVEASYDGVYMYQHPGYDGDRICFPRGSYIGDLTAWSGSVGNWDNKASSHRWTSDC